MTKAVFFDWYDTLVHYEPPRHKLFDQAFRKFGFGLSMRDILRGISIGDRYFFEENHRSPVKQRSPEEHMAVYTSYPRAILAEAGLESPPALPEQIMQMLIKPFGEAVFVLFDDVLPTVKALKQRYLILGLLTNADNKSIALFRQMGLEPYFDFVVTSEEAGVEKPAPGIFLKALERAGVSAGEAVHVGDQYDIDIAGALGVDIAPVLLDRNGIYPDSDDCRRIRSLNELVDYL